MERFLRRFSIAVERADKRLKGRNENVEGRGSGWRGWRGWREKKAFRNVIPAGRAGNPEAREEALPRQGGKGNGKFCGTSREGSIDR